MLRLRATTIVGRGGGSRVGGGGGRGGGRVVGVGWVWGGGGGDTTTKLEGFCRGYCRGSIMDRIYCKESIRVTRSVL